MLRSSFLSRMTTSFRMSTTSTTSKDYVHRRPRRFAPLDPRRPDEHGAPRLKGIIFDVDGTLCLPQNYMFGEMRSALGIPKSVDILDHIHSLSNVPDQAEDANGTAKIDRSHQSSPQSRAHEAIRSIERNAMTTQRPQPGLVELMSYLSSRKIPKALCTRNFPAPVHHLLDKYLPGEVFGPIITRETTGLRPKPSPEGLWEIVRVWNATHATQMTETKDTDHDHETQKSLPNDDALHAARRFMGEGIIMVGDSFDDLAAGHRAGAATVLLTNDYNQELSKHEYTDLSISRLDDLIKVLDEGFVGTAVAKTDVDTAAEQYWVSRLTCHE